MYVTFALPYTLLSVGNYIQIRRILILQTNSHTTGMQESLLHGAEFSG